MKTLLKFDFDSAVLLYSGGLDSTVLAADMLASGVQLTALIMEYGQRHYREIDYAVMQCQKRNIPFQIAQLPRVFGSSKLTDGSGTVVVPGRNLVFLSIAASVAVAVKAQAVAIGTTKEDWDMFPDCRPGFISLFDNMARNTIELGVEIVAPYSRLTKLEVVEIGRRLGVDFNETLSCYTGDNCGQCDACLKRNAALK